METQPHDLRALPGVARRVAAVKEHRAASKRPGTQKKAAFPMQFAEIRQPTSTYLLIPSVSSERRRYIPMGFMPGAVIASNLVFVVPSATIYHFGVLSSAMHMAWVRYVGGRLESRYRYSKDIVYNNFPWPVDATEEAKQAVAVAAQAVLDARAGFPSNSFADLYDPVAMPAALTEAHQALDRAVDGVYGKRRFQADADRVSFLFELFRRLTTLLPAEPRKSRRRR